MACDCAIPSYEDYASAATLLWAWPGKSAATEFAHLSVTNASA